MLEVRTYDDSAQVVSDFTRRVWLDRYQLSTPVIEWSAAYFEQQLLWERPGQRDFLVAAYDGGQLVGTLFAERVPFQLRGQPISATMGSWLTVDPDHRGRGIARMLAEEQRRRHRAHDAKFMMGFGVLGTDGPKFWHSQPDTRSLGTVGFWARLFDANAVAEWSMSWRDRVLTRVLGPLRSGPPAVNDGAGVRVWSPSDLAASQRLLARFEALPLGYRWADERMRHQLEPNTLTRTLVLERDGGVQGLINYYVVEMTARTTMPVAVIDFLAIDALTAAERRRLLDSAMLRMFQDGAKLALLLRLGCYPGKALWSAGFLPLPGDTSYLCTLVEPGLDLDGVDSMYLHWR